MIKTMAAPKNVEKMKIENNDLFTSGSKSDDMGSPITNAIPLNSKNNNTLDAIPYKPPITMFNTRLLIQKYLGRFGSILW